MKNKKILGGLFALFVISIWGMSSVSAHGGNNINENQFSAMNTGQLNHNFDSGREFGQHVSEHNYMFSGTMNPGVHHRGYSSFVR